jgi:hypothetical protein
LVLAVLAFFVTVLLCVASVLFWIFTFSWLNTLSTIQKWPIFTRFIVSAVLPLVAWTGFGYAPPHFPSAKEIAVEVAKLLPKSEPKPGPAEKSPAFDAKPEPSAPSERSKLSPQPKTPSHQPLVAIEFASHVVQYVDRYKSEGAIVRHNEYGFAAIVRVRNHGKTTEQLKALEITGDLDADGNEATFAEGRSLEEIGIEYERRKPYYRVSFVSFPINATKIAPGGEEFIRFMILDPTYQTTLSTVRGDDAEKYIGFRGENPAVPSLLTTVPIFVLSLPLHDLNTRFPAMLNCSDLD